MSRASPFGPGSPAVGCGEPGGPGGLLRDIRGIASQEASRPLTCEQVGIEQWPEAEIACNVVG
jgi:hypothetical protein